MTIRLFFYFFCVLSLTACGGQLRAPPSPIYDSSPVAAMNKGGKLYCKNVVSRSEKYKNNTGEKARIAGTVAGAKAGRDAAKGKDGEAVAAVFGGLVVGKVVELADIYLNPGKTKESSTKKIICGGDRYIIDSGDVNQF